MSTYDVDAIIAEIEYQTGMDDRELLRIGYFTDSAEDNAIVARLHQRITAAADIETRDDTPFDPDRDSQSQRYSARMFGE